MSDIYNGWLKNQHLSHAVVNLNIVDDKNENKK